MKLSEEWVLTKLGKEYIAVPVGETAKEYKCVVKLNNTGRDIWEGLTEGLDEKMIADKMVKKYENLSKEKALEDIFNVVERLKLGGLLKD